MRVSEWHLVGSYQFCTNHAVFEFPELAPVCAGIEPSGVSPEQHLYAVAKLIGDKRRVHACHGAHGSVRVATGVLPARPDLEFCRRLQSFFAGYASRHGLSLRNIVIFLVSSSGFSTRRLSCTRCEPIYSIFNPLRSGRRWRRSLCRRRFADKQSGCEGSALLSGLCNCGAYRV